MAQPFTKFASLSSFLILTAFASVSNADEYDHIDRMAVKIQSTAKKLVNETVHYRHTGEYQHLVADTNEISRLAKHIHEVTHFEGNLYHLASDLRQLDQKFHHLESVFDRVEEHASHGHGGHIHGNTAHVRRLLDKMEGYIHHIQEDVNELSRHVVISRPVYIPPVRTYQRRPYGGYGSGHGIQHGHGSHGHDSHGHGSQGQRSRGIGFSIGGGSSKIQIRF